MIPTWDRRHVISYPLALSTWKFVYLLPTMAAEEENFPEIAATTRQTTLTAVRFKRTGRLHKCTNAQFENYRTLDRGD